MVLQKLFDIYPSLHHPETLRRYITHGCPSISLMSALITSHHGSFHSSLCVRGLGGATIDDMEWTRFVQRSKEEAQSAEHQGGEEG